MANIEHRIQITLSTLDGEVRVGTPWGTPPEWAGENLTSGALNRKSFAKQLGEHIMAWVNDHPESAEMISAIDLARQRKAQGDD